MSDLSGRTTVVVGAFAEAGGGQQGRVPGRRFSSWSPATTL
jgi:hypothetical protein